MEKTDDQIARERASVPDLRLPEAFARHRLASLSQTPATPMDDAGENSRDVR